MTGESGASAFEGWTDGEPWDDAAVTGGRLPDLFAGAVDTPNSGAARLRDGLRLLAEGSAADAQAAIEGAIATGLPADLVPHAAIAHGGALLRCERNDEAAAVLQDGWRHHPDVAALAALLGVAWFAEGRPVDAARAMFAALAGDDPDRTLERYRWLIGASVRTVMS